MARKSKHEHLKKEILRLFAEGCSVKQVKRRYPDISQRTLYDWQKKQKSNPLYIPKKETMLNITDAVRDELTWAKKILKEEIKNPSENGGVKIQGINALTRVIETEARLYPRTLRGFAELLTVNDISPQEFIEEMQAAYQRRDEAA